MAQRTAERTRPRHGSQEDTGPGDEHIVTVFDNPVNTWEEVIAILQKATGCPYDEAYNETWEVHHLGRSVVHHAARPECLRVARVIRTIGIKVEVSPL